MEATTPMESATPPSGNIHAVLKELAERHRELREAKDQLRLLPLQLKGKENEYARHGATLQDLREQLKKLKVEADQRELSLKTGEAKLVDLQVKRNLCRSTEEYAAIQTEMKNLQAANDKLAEETLELIGRQDAKLAALKAEEQAVAAGQQELEKFRVQVQYSLDKFTRRVTALEADIAAAEQKLDEASLTIYRRNLQAKGEPGLAAVDGSGACSSCYIEQSPQIRMELASGRTARCKSCGVLLYAE